MVTTDVEPLQEVLDSDAAEILSCALSHKRITKSPFKLTDPYFTKEQWEIVLDGQGELHWVWRRGCGQSGRSNHHQGDPIP